MSKQAFGWGCALFVIVGMWNPQQLTAQEVEVRAVSAGYSSEATEARINAALSQRLKKPLQYDGEQLDIVLNTIAEEYNLPIIFDRAALDEVAISPESEISINLRRISLNSALNLIFKEPGLEELCYMIDNEVMLITTVEKRNETLVTQVYRVDDLLDSHAAQFNDTGSDGDPDSLIDLIVCTVEADSWMENGTGDGEIKYFPPGMIVISQTRRVHDLIEELFVKIRHTKKQVLAVDRSNAQAAKPVTKGFPIGVGNDKPLELFQDQLKSAVQNSVHWSEGDLTEQETWIQVLPNRVLVRHLPTVISQVSVVLADMKILDRSQLGGGGIGCGSFGGRAESEGSPDLAE